MISEKLKTVFGLSILLFIAHGVEEIMTGFYNLNQWDEWIFGLLQFSSIHEATFITFQVMLWLTLVILYFSLASERTRLYLLALAGVAYIFELHHPLKALLAGGYYPGLITSLLFPVVAVYFWREWLHNYRTT